VVYDQSIDKVSFPAEVVDEVQSTWEAFLHHAGSPEAAGEIIFNSWWEAAPSLHAYFVSPRAVLFLRIVQGISPVVAAMRNPTMLKNEVEQISFRHLDRPVKPAAVDIVREAMLDMWEQELGPNVFNTRARKGWQCLLNYMGGAYCFVGREYASRVRIIQRSWRTATSKAAEDLEEGEIELLQVDEDNNNKVEEVMEDEDSPKEHRQRDMDEESDLGGKAAGKEVKVPNTFKDMFLFNAAVMGFGTSNWMSLILEQFDAIVTNVANSYRLSEECDVLTLVLSKYEGTILLNEYRSVMLATLRSLAPKEWDSDHEVAWGWLWENVEKILKGQLGKPKTQEKALERFISNLSQDMVDYFRKELYKRFFQNAPSGQDHFKQSTTRLYFLADRMVETTMDMFRQPRKMVQEISGLGLRHVGYGIPTELFGPYVSAGVDVVRSMTTDENALSGFRWSLTLVSKILVRAVSEGATLVMRAINTNQELALKKAISIAPRGKRATELLNISVGTQSISPLFWAIESGALNSARAMIVDLLTIRADRDVYYYGCDDLFTRHPDIIQRLCKDAPTLLWTLLDGLIWRSRLTYQGLRRVNYYVKHLVQDLDGNSNQALEWLAEHKDPKIIVHPVVVLFADLIWNRLAMYHFLLGRCYFLFALCVFVTSQALLFRHDGTEALEENIARFVCRCFLYFGSLSKLFYNQCKLFYSDMKTRSLMWFYLCPVPRYLSSPQHAGNLLLVILLILMYIEEPILWCGIFTTDDPVGLLFTNNCEASEPIKDLYSIFSCFAMLLYWVLLMDFTLFSMKISAFVLVCGHVLADVGLFVLAIVFLVLAFATAISSLNHGLSNFTGIDPWLVSLVQMTLGMFPARDYDDFQSEVAVLTAVSVFVAVVSIFLLNLLIAQLNQSYHDVFEDMQGFARLNRAGVIAATLEQVPRKNWMKFREGLLFEERLEFNEGDVGLAGGIQVTEAANINPLTEDTIRRYGGSTAPTMPWPQEHTEDTQEEDKFERLEKLILRSSKKKRGGANSDASGSSLAGDSSSQAGPVLSQPLQYSANLPSMVEGFRVVDQACPILDEDGSQAGILRLLVFLEDLGAAKVARSEEAPKGEVAAPETAPVRRRNEAHQADAAKAAGLGATAATTASQKSLLESAFGLELWRQTEEDKFRAYLAEQEADLKARLEEEYRQREEARAAEFTQRQAKIQHVEATVRRKLQELQQKELSIQSEEARVGSLQLKAQRDSEMAMAQREDVAKQEMSELSHSLELSRARSHFLEEQVAGMEAQLSAASTKLRSLEEAKSERDTELRAVMAPSPELKEELQELRLRLREQEVRGEAIAASRDHFKHKVQELCGRLLGSGPAQNTQTQETALTALGVLGTSSAGDVTNSITEALRKVRQELANLASHWDRADPDQTREEPERPAAGPVRTSQDSEKAERHLVRLLRESCGSGHLCGLLGNTGNFGIAGSVRLDGSEQRRLTKAKVPCCRLLRAEALRAYPEGPIPLNQGNSLKPKD
ncbi:cep120, partial [Symbiodinium sp. KB8]